MSLSPVSAVLGLQWGDEGKGKLVDILAPEASIVCRCAGGNNAGHTVVVGGVAYDFHLLPRCVSVCSLQRVNSLEILSGSCE